MWVSKPWLFLVTIAALAGLFALVRVFDVSAQYERDGDAYADAAQYDYALRSYELALEDRGPDEELQFKMARVLAELGREEESRQLLDGLDDARAALQLGWLVYDDGDFDLAFAEFERAFEILQQDPDSYTREDRAEIQAALGWGRFSLRGCDSALANFRRALELIPDNERAQAGLLECGLQP